MLDVAPVELFTWMDKKSLQFLNFPPEMIEEGIDVVMHWINEDGQPASMKGGAKIVPTVRRQRAVKKFLNLTVSLGLFQDSPGSGYCPHGGSWCLPNQRDGEAIYQEGVSGLQCVPDNLRWHISAP